MARDLVQHFARTMAVLLSNETNVGSLVALLGNDIENFFDAADMSETDLSGQDLRGFTFFGTDLRDARLENAVFDENALSNAVLEIPSVPQTRLGFRGIGLRRVDRRGRVTMPSGLRAAFFREAEPHEVEIVVALHEADKCLVAYPLSYFDALLERLSEQADAADDRDIIRKGVSACENVSLDSSGRIVIPSLFRQIAGIETDAFFFGVGTRVEIWSPDILSASAQVTPHLKYALTFCLQKRAIGAST